MGHRRLLGSDGFRDVGPRMAKLFPLVQSFSDTRATSRRGVSV